MTLLDLDSDQLLSSTRAVRKRLDLSRPVPDEVIRECVSIALQSPSGSNNPTMQFVIVRDAGKRKAIGDVYRQCYGIYKSMDGIYIGTIDKGSPEDNVVQQRSASSADWLGEHMGEAPVLVLPCTTGRLDNQPAMISASIAGNIAPAAWSFMLAARARGLGGCWTTVHLMMEQAVADIVGIPFAEIQQFCLIPLGYTIGTEFKPARRPSPDSIIHWDRW